MTLRDLHSPLYVAVGMPADLSRAVKPGETVEVPLWASFLSGSTAYGDGARRCETRSAAGTRSAANGRAFATRRGGSVPAVDVGGARAAVGADAGRARRWPCSPSRSRTAAAPSCIATSRPSWWRAPQPDEVTLEDGRRARLARVAPARVLGRALVAQAVERARRAEGERRRLGLLRVSRARGRRTSGSPTSRRRRSWSRPRRKRLYGKDRPDAREMSRRLHARPGHPRPEPEPQRLSDDGPAPLPERGHGAGQRRGRRPPRAARTIRPITAASCPGTRSSRTRSCARRARTAISWRSRSRARRWRRRRPNGALVVRLEVDEALPGGLAIYGARFGRYPLDPTVVFVRK